MQHPLARASPAARVGRRARRSRPGRRSAASIPRVVGGAAQALSHRQIGQPGPRARRSPRSGGPRGRYLADPRSRLSSHALARSRRSEAPPTAPFVRERSCRPALPLIVPGGRGTGDGADARVHPESESAAIVDEQRSCSARAQPGRLSDGGWVLPWANTSAAPSIWSPTTLWHARPLRAARARGAAPASEALVVVADGPGGQPGRVGRTTGGTAPACREHQQRTFSGGSLAFPPLGRYLAAKRFLAHCC